MNNDEREAIVQHLLAEHRALDSLLFEARADLAACRGPDVDAPAADVERILRRIRAKIAHHFQEEEAGGCLEEAALKRPQLSSEMNRVLAEHGELLTLVDELIRMAQPPAGSAPEWAKFERAYENFYRRMRAHEAAENDLLRQGLGAVLDAEDCGAAATRDY